MKKSPLLFLLSLAFLGTACTGAKDDQAARAITTVTTTSEAIASPPTVPVTASGPTAGPVEPETPSTAPAIRPVSRATARPVSTTTTKPPTIDDELIPDVFRPGPDPVEPVSTTTTTARPITPTTTTTRPVVATTTTTTRPAPKGEVVAESSEHVVWNSGDPYCKPVRVTLVNRSDTRVVSVDITFYLYDFPSGATNYWEGPYRKMVSIPADNGTRAPYTVTVDVCPRRDPARAYRWSTHPNHPDYPGGVQLTWRW